MNEIFNFKIRDTQYFLFHNKEIPIYKKRKNNEATDVTEDEKELIDTIFECLSPSSNLIHFGSFHYKNKQFYRFIDRKTGMHLIYEIKNNYLQIPPLDEIKEFHSIYNNQEDILFHNISSGSKDKQPYFKRLVKIGHKLISVMVAANIVFVPASLSTIAYATDDNITVVETNASYDYTEDETRKNTTAVSMTDEEREIAANKYMNALSRNPNFSDEEKNFLYSYKQFFFDHAPYLDEETVIQKLSIYTLEYDENATSPGMTYHNTNHIKIKGSGFNKDVATVLGHEFLHISTPPMEKWNFDFVHPHPLYEAVHAVINNAYGPKELFKEEFEKQDSYDDSYPSAVPYVYLMEEIFDVEVLRQFHDTVNVHVLIDYLNSLEPNEAMAEKFVITLNNILYQQPEEIKKQMTADLYDCIDYYHRLKYGIPAMNNINIAMIKNFEASKGKILEQIRNSGTEIYSDNIYIKRWKNIFNTTAAENEKEVTVGVLYTPGNHHTEELLKNNNIVKKFNDAGVVYSFALDHKGFLTYQVKPFLEETTKQQQGTIR